MQIKVYTINVKLPGWLRRTLVMGVVPAVILGICALVYATAVTGQPDFASGEPLSASSLNAHLGALQTQIAALDPRLASLEQRTSYFASQTSTVETSGNDTWIDVPNVSVNVVATGAVTAEIVASGFSYGIGGTNEWALCSFRCLVDNGGSGATTQTSVRSPNFGDGASWTVLDRVGLVAGTHTIRLQTMRIFTGAVTSGDANCRTPAGAARMLVTVR